MTEKTIPVITIDGPSGTGKGTIASLLAKTLGWYLLDSGALYRAMAWAVLQDGMDPKDEKRLAPLLESIDLEIRETAPDFPPQIWCQGQDISEAIREEECGTMASKIAAIPLVRKHLLHYQRVMRRSPGLIADGRDMGSVVFPDASVKFFLHADPEVRANRRHKQLKEKEINVSLRQIREDLAVRDDRDENRKISPMKAMPDMILIDTTHLVVEQVFSCVMEKLRERLPRELFLETGGDY